MSEWTLSPAWGAWIDENLAAGAQVDEVIEALIDEGVPDRLAEAEAYRRQLTRAQAQADQYALMLTLQRRLYQLAPPDVGVARHAGLSAEAFFAHFYATNQPVILTDYTTHWPALSQWCPQYFKDWFGSVKVAVTADRESDPDYDMRHTLHTRHMHLADYVDAVLSAGQSNDLYMVANNRNADLPALAPLFDDMVFNRGLLDPSRRKGCVALWLGPAGTVTPMHHDTCNILFCQIQGRKRFRLYPPCETRLLHGARSMYGAIDPETSGPVADHLVGYDVELLPGDTLFIPVGWWHHVRALDVSVSIAFSNFTRPNQFDWYRPGELG